MPKRKAKYFNYSPKKDLVLFLVLCVLCIVTLVFFIYERVDEEGGNNFFRSPKIIEPVVSEEVYAEDYGVFFDSFSGTGFIDKENTNLYLNGSAGAIMFPPDYSWELDAKASTTTNISVTSSFATTNFNDFLGPYQDERCLGKNCLTQNDLKLYYNKRLLTLPTKIKKTEIVAISIAALEKKWLVGFTLKSGEEYRGEVYSFDGKKFTALVLPKPLTSKYFGLFGFGGKDDDFLVIYGAYEGIAYRFQGKKTVDLSRFFNIRTMRKGFKAEVIRTVKGADINWYIYSSTNLRPQFLKLWQNGTEDIAGEIVFDIFASNIKEANFKLLEIKPSEINFLAQVKAEESDLTYAFSDRGFYNSNTGFLNFLPIYQAQDKPFITFEKIKSSLLKLDPGSQEGVDLLFSITGATWQDLPQGIDIAFETEKNEEPEFFNSYFLRVVFSSASDKFYSPFLEEILFEYYGLKKI